MEAEKDINLDVLEDTNPIFNDILIVFCIDQLDFKSTVEWLHHGIVPTVTFSTHARYTAMLSHEVLIFICPVLYTTIWVDYDALRRLTWLKRHF